MRNLIYVLSLVFLAIGIFLLLEYPDSGRMNLLSGSFTGLGIVLNVGAFFILKNRPVSHSA
jgi:hypothetical protein